MADGASAGPGPGPEEPVARWRRAAASTSPADRPAAEAGVRLAYRRAGLAEPERIVWADSPLGAIHLLTGPEGAGRRGRSVREEVRNGPWSAERSRLHAELGPAGWAAHWGATGGRLWESTRLLTARITACTVEAFAAAPDTAGGGTAPAPGGSTGVPAVLAWAAEKGVEVHDRGRVAGGAPAPSPGEAARAAAPAAEPGPDAESGARLLLLDALHGQQDAAWLSAFGTASGSALEGVAAVAEAAGWWWPYERLAVVCERPAELHRDEAGRLDRADGPALAFRDGLAAYSWRGMPVPGGFLAELGALTAERIRSEDNAELRRVMLEHYGYDRYLAEVGAVPEHRDETGVLWRIAMEGDEDTVMVEVLNSTPEPDGSTRTYWLRVPPRTRTAKEGVAWTFGLTPEQYEPLRQT